MPSKRHSWSRLLTLCTGSAKVRIEYDRPETEAQAVRFEQMCKEVIEASNAYVTWCNENMPTTTHESPTPYASEVHNAEG